MRTTPRDDRTPEALLRRWREHRDAEALGALFDAAAPGLFRLALSLEPDPASAEDALQETFLLATEAADRWDPERPVIPWLAGVLRHKVQEGRRARRRTPSPERLPPPRLPDDPALAAETEEESARLRSAMDALPEPYREAALLRWRHGLEPAEIAALKRVPPGTAWSWLHRALARLRGRVGSLPAILAGVRPERGLDAVRDAVLHAAGAPAAGTAATTAGTAGALAGKKLAIAGAVAAAAVAVAVALRPARPPASASGLRALLGGDGGGIAVPAAREPVARPSVPPPDPSAPPLGSSADDAPVEFTGRCILAASEEPVEGATVEVPGCGAVTTGPDGRFAVRGPLPAGALLLRVAAAGAASHRASLAAMAPGDAADLGDVRLGPARPLPVRVLRPDGRPAAGATVRAYVMQIPSSGLVPSRRPDDPDPGPAAEATTGPDGAAVLGGLGPGFATLVASAPGFARSQAVGASTGSASADPPPPLLLRAAMTVTGTVVAAGDGAPVAGARVEAWEHGGGWSPFVPQEVATVTDAAGAFRLEDVPTGPAVVAAARPGTPFHAAGEVVAPGAPSVVLRLPGAGSVRGLAYDQGSRRPVAGAALAVWVRPGADAVGFSRALVRTDAAGRFRLEGLPHGGLVEVFPHGAPWCFPAPDPAEPGSLFRVTAGVPAWNLDVPLFAAGTVTGRVTDGRGAAVAARVLIVGGAMTGPTTASESARQEWTDTDADGRFRFSSVPPGFARVVARESGPDAPGERPLRVSGWSGVRVPAGGSATADLVAARGLEVSGVVLEADGRPASAKVFSLNRALGSRQVGFIPTDAEGRFRLSGIPPEPLPIPGFSPPDLAVAASGPGGRAQSEPLPARAGVPVEGVVLRLVPKEARRGGVAGRVLGPDGGPVPGARAFLDRNGQGVRRVREARERAGPWTPYGDPIALAPDGSFRVEGVDLTWRTEVTVLADAPGHLPSGVEVALEGGAVREGVEVRLDSGLALRGRLLAVDGAPAAGVEVRWARSPEGSIASPAGPAATVTDAGGRFVLRALPAGHLGLAFGERERPLLLRSGIWAEDLDGETEFRLPSLRTLRGTALWEDGSPAAGIPLERVPVDGAPGARLSATTSADGEFAFEDAPDGAFVLEVGRGSPGEGSDAMPSRSAAYAEGTDRADVTLRRGLPIEGTVVDASGAPVARVGISAAPEGRRAAAGLPRWTTTDHGGRFRVRGLDAGPWTVTASRDEARAEALGVAAGTEGLVLRLSSAGAVSGVVRDGAGAPAGGVSVALVQVGPGSRSSVGTTSGADGRFRLPGREGETYLVEADGGARGRASREGVAAGTADLDLRLGAGPRPGALRGRVVDGDGAPVGGVVVRARRIGLAAGCFETVLLGVTGAEPDPDAPGLGESLPQNPGSRVEVRADADGAFDLGLVEPGRWAVWAGAPGGEWGPRAVAVVDGARGDLALPVARGWTARARLVDAAGAPRVFARVSLSVRVPGPGGFGVTLRVHARSGRGGLLEIPGLPPGAVEVVDGDAADSARWTVEEQPPGAAPAELRSPR